MTEPEIHLKFSRSARVGAETITVMLLSFWSVIQLYAWWRPPFNSIVFAVMLAVMLPRVLKRIKFNQLGFEAVSFGMGTALAIVCGMLIKNDDALRVLGAVLFAAGVALPVWVRRFGDVWKAAGTLFAVPFMAILVLPVPINQSLSFFGWELAAAAIALFWTVMIKAIGNTPKMSAAETEPSVTGKNPRLLSSTKMSIQLAAATLAAFACAELADPDHLVWPVLTVLIVHSGNRGRGDILWKGVQRAAGALIGVTIASLAAISISPKDSRAIVAIFVILAIAAIVREFGYIFWAICITVALVFLYSFFGQSGAEMNALLVRRLLGITMGSIIGIAGGYFLFPVRVVDAVRMRLNALLSAAGDFAVSLARGNADKTALEKLVWADNELSQFNGVTKAARYFGLGTVRRLHGAIMGAHALVNGLQNETGLKETAGFAALAREIGNARRSLSSNAASVDSPEPDSSNPLIAYVLEIINADLGRKKQ